jgi:hypothetical protein
MTTTLALEVLQKKLYFSVETANKKSLWLQYMQGCD